MPSMVDSPRWTHSFRHEALSAGAHPTMKRRFSVLAYFAISLCFSACSNNGGGERRASTGTTTPTTSTPNPSPTLTPGPTPPASTDLPSPVNPSPVAPEPGSSPGPVTPAPVTSTPPDGPTTDAPQTLSSTPTQPDTSSTTTDPTSAPVDEGEPRIHFVGRVVRNGDQATFAWSGSGVIAAFKGTRVSVRLNDSGDNYFNFILDDLPMPPAPPPRAGSTEYVLAEGLSPEERHVIQVYRRTEASLGNTTFEGFDFGPEGELLPPPVRPRRLEIVGDSITCGYGNLGADTSCGFSPETQSHYQSYGAIAARALDAELSTVAWSGKGVVFNYDTDVTDPMPTLYNRVLPSDPNSRWDFSVKPDAVVINLGTNDFSTDGDPTLEQFRDAYVGLLEQIRAGAPDAFILCTNGNMLTGSDLDAARAGIHAAVDAFKASGDTKIAAWDMNVPNNNPGCDGHPSVATHELMAEALVTELKRHLPW